MATILIAESDEIIEEMLSRQLQSRGFEVITASDGKRAVDLATHYGPDLIVMDLSLPAMDGWTAARAIKTAPETTMIPIIAVTAHAMIGDREKALAAGCDDYDTKPIDFERLLGKVSALIS